MDKGKQITVRNDLGGRSGRGCNNFMTSDVFISRSDLKILLHDSDPENCEEISTLLTKCSYEGTRPLWRSATKTLPCLSRKRVYSHFWLNTRVSAILTFMLYCYSKVISVSSLVEVVDALNAEGSHIDILLASIDPYMQNSMKMLKYINEEFQHIPVIIMLSRQDHTSVIYKCLQLGAADYLVKPLCSSELSNLWMYQCRSREMVGLTLMHG
ncbi:Two-component response regulator-like APRR1 [Morella rubra]|uniref:Two-component response regulator-like APRR1 n=1 Tax=Morella rubra TaxID=262757 RepID=A0A6A1VXY5_9ROSI|nr:Two-component response regulator-like APRR1 [Morella rubra]